MKRVLLATAALMAAVVLWIAFTLPPVRMALPRADDDGTVAGVLHVHTNRSDGYGSPQDAAAAASRAGLKFIILTDHGDATRSAPASPLVQALMWAAVVLLLGVAVVAIVSALARRGRPE